MKLRYLPFFFCTFFSYYLFSQSNYPLVRETYLQYEKSLNYKQSNSHTAIKPFLQTDEMESIQDSVKKSYLKKSDSLFTTLSERKIKRKSKFSVTGIFDSYFGYEQASQSNTKLLLGGGIQLNGKIKNKLFLSTTFLSGNAAYPSYLDSAIKNSAVIPGFGSAYKSNLGYSNQYYAGYVSYSPNKIFNFQAGRDKQFWGDGYRSLFLSDASTAMPFFKISTTIWKLKYVSLFTSMKDITKSPHSKNDFLNKYGTFHYLSWNVSKRINLSLFESIIWQGTDTNRVRSFDVNYLNPVIFFRPVEYSLGSSDNAFVGGAFKIKVGARQRQQFYGQLILDEFLLKEVLAIFKKIANPLDPTIKYGWWANKQGVQLGFKSFDLFTAKNLTFQTEINAVRPYTYSHGSVQQNYAHYNQPLAHPLGANFAESVSFLNYKFKKWIFETQFLYAIYGKDEKGINYGQNIFLSYNTHPYDYGNKFFQGLKTNLFYTRFKIGYYLIPSADLLAEVGVAMRQEKNSLNANSSNFVFIGLRTAIFNKYNDF